MDTKTANPALRTVELDEPIKRGDTTIDKIQLRKPKSGELRGLNLIDIGQLDVNAMRTLIPRISMPTLTAPEVDAMDPADLLAIGAEIGSFLLQKANSPV